MAASSRAADSLADGAGAAAQAQPHVSSASVEPALVIADQHEDAATAISRVGEPVLASPTSPSSSAHASPLLLRAPAPHTSNDASSSPSSSPETSLKHPSPSRPERPERPTSIVPVFWQHARHASRVSVASLTSTSAGITLTDNTSTTLGSDDNNHNNNDNPNASPDSYDGNGGPWASGALGSPLWARQVDIDGYVKIEGDVPGVGGYIVWLVKVATLDGGGSIVLRKRYSEFEALRALLAATFPRAGEALPQLPPKSIFYKFRPSFLEKRRVGLAYFLNCILLNPEFSGTPAVREFIFSSD